MNMLYLEFLHYGHNLLAVRGRQLAALLYDCFNLRQMQVFVMQLNEPVSERTG